MRRQTICIAGTPLLTKGDNRLWVGWNPHTSDPLPRANDLARSLSPAGLDTASAEKQTLRPLGSNEAASQVALFPPDRVRIGQSRTMLGRNA